MKKINNKGFTLVELLAVIIILAIVVGITIPAITNVINDSKNSSMGVAVDAAEKYLTEQYSLMNVDYNSASSTFKTKFGNVILGTTMITLNSATDGDQAMLKELGFELVDVSTVTVKYNASAVACVTITKIPSTSKYYTAKYWKAADGTPLTGAANQSKSC